VSEGFTDKTLGIVSIHYLYVRTWA
jgi:hypothetical protein